jgi:hypothetical protein
MKGELNWQALQEWAMCNPFSTATIVFQDGVPMKFLTPTPDGNGMKQIVIEKEVRAMVKAAWKSGK